MKARGDSTDLHLDRRRLNHNRLALTRGATTRRVGPRRHSLGILVRSSSCKGQRDGYNW